MRQDVNAILFGEPLTVIDSHLKWQLRCRQKELRQQVEVAVIYVTRDQVEALTFADTVAVMLEGTMAQAGTPVELFDQPQHTFMGYFIGPPGMNVLPDIGLLGHSINSIGIDYKVTRQPVSAWMTTVIMGVCNWTWLLALLCCAGLSAIPDDDYQAAHIDGTTTFLFIVLVKMALGQFDLGPAAAMSVSSHSP